MNRKQKRGRGLFASALAMISAAALALGGAAAAQAAPSTIPDSDKTANLHITKLKTPDAGAADAGNGTQKQDLPSAGINGVQFSVWKLQPNLATNAGWQDASKYQLNLTNASQPVVTDQKGAAVTLGAATQTGTTKKVGAQDGVLNFIDLDIGLYLVQETKTPPGVSPAVPFLVTLPLTNPSKQSEWLYDIYVYPKNSEVGITKTVDDSNAWEKGDGNDLSWTIDADVPHIAGKTAGAWAKPQKFEINDQLDAHLTLSNVTVKAVDAAGHDVTANQLVPGDYTITPNPAQGDGQKVTVTLTDNGLTKLHQLAGNAGTKVRVTITTQATGADLGGTGSARIVENAADVTIEANGQSTNIKTDHKPATKWGNITFRKFLQHKDGTANTPLAGAEFKIFKSKADADGNDHALATAATSGQDGTVALNGIRVSDWQNDATIKDSADYRVYWIAETKAPEGAELLADAIPVVLLSDGSVHQAEVGSDGKVTAVTGSAMTDVVNVEKNAGFSLPLTGGTGTLLLTVVGIALLAAVLLVVRRRRARETHTV